MKLLLDSNGNVVVKDGKPVYVHDDGKEIPFDAPGAVASIAELNNEAKGHRLTAKETAAKLAVFEGIDPVKAKEALATVENLDTKKLVDAGKIDAVKAQMAEGFEATKKQMIDNFNAEKTTLADQLTKTNDHIFKMTVESEFYKSPLFNGKDQKTTMTADVAYAVFNKHFNVEMDGDAPKVIAKVDGEEVLSRQNPGKPASFHEAMDLIWEKYPSRTRYETQNNGGGGTGNHGHGGAQEFANAQERIAAGIKESRQQH